MKIILLLIKNMTTSNTFLFFILASVLMLVSFGPEPCTAPFPPDDPRAVFNAFIIPWWQQAPRWLRSHIHVHWTGEPLPPDGRLRRYKPENPLEQQPTYQHENYHHYRPVRPHKPRTPQGNFLSRLGFRRRSRPLSLHRSWNEFLDRLLRRRRRRRY